MDGIRQRELLGARRRKVLSENPQAMREAIANFPLCVAVMANDLRKFNEALRYWPLNEESEQAAVYLEREIRRVYWEMFGVEIGAQ